MNATEQTASEARRDVLKSRGQVYKAISQAFAFPAEELEGYLKGPFLTELAGAIRGLPFSEALAEDFSKLVESVEAIHVREVTSLQEEYNNLFAPGGSYTYPPYETEYLSSNVFAKAQSLADISGFYLAFGLKLSPESRERPDYIGTELEFMHVIIIKELYALLNGRKVDGETCSEAQRRFLEDHLGRWVPGFCRVIGKASNTGFYRALLSFASRFTEEDCIHLSVKPVQPRTPLPMAERTGAEQRRQEEQCVCPMADECGGGLSP